MFGLKTAVLVLVLGADCLCAGEAAVEWGVTAVVAPEAGCGVQGKCSVAFGNGVYLVAWQDGAENADTDGSGTDIFCARITPDGKALDSKGIPVCKAKDHQLRPKVAFGGGVFLIVWEDYRSGTDGDIYAARVNPEGKVLDPDGFPVAAIKDRNQVYGSVASNGKDFLVAWMDYWTYPTYGIAAARVSPEGQATPKNGVLLIKEKDEKIKKAADEARNSKQLVIPWAKGEHTGPVGSANFPDLAFGNNQYFCLFNDYIEKSGPRVIRISAEGELKLDADNQSALRMGRVRGFGHAFVTGPQKAWMYFSSINVGRGQEGKVFTYFAVKPDGSLPAVDHNGNLPTQSGSDERKIVELNSAGVFDGSKYWIAMEAKKGIALGWMDLDGKLSDLSLKGDPEGSALMLAEAAWCAQPALASDSKGGVMAVWSEDAGIDNCRLKFRTLREK
jgi:hypothetical protein